MLPAAATAIARIECLAQDLDYEVPTSLEATDDVGRMLDELVDYVSDDADLPDDVREELLRRIDELREGMEEEES